jgi:hypothetical protein
VPGGCLLCVDQPWQKQCPWSEEVLFQGMQPVCPMLSLPILRFQAFRVVESLRASGPAAEAWRCTMRYLA